MATKHLSGNQGEKHVILDPADLYLCDETFVVLTRKTESTVQSGRVLIRKAPPSARWKGGHIQGLMTREAEYSMYSKTGNGGAPFHLETGTPDFTVEHLHVDGCCWDPIRPQGARPTILDCLLEDARDDGVEADDTSVLETLTLKRTAVLNAHTCISTTPGGGATPKPYRWVLEDCLFSLANNHRDSREKRKYPWNPTDYGSGPFWKTQEDGKGGGILIKGCTLMARRLPKQAEKNHRLIESAMSLEAGSGNNLFVWLGPQTKAENGGIDVVKVQRWGGSGQMSIPVSILGTGAERDRIKAVFNFTDVEGIWDEREDRWFREIWRGETVEPPPVDPPPVDPCADLRAENEALKQELARTLAELAGMTEAMQSVNDTSATALQTDQSGPKE